MNQKKLRCLVVDDEAPAHAILKNYIAQLDALEFGASVFNAVEAQNALHREPFDLVFLDINMPRMTGLELLESLPKPPKVILTTAYAEFALKSYDLGVADYLLKPIAFPRFLKAVNKVILDYGVRITDYGLADAAAEATNGLVDAASANPHSVIRNPQSLWVKTDRGRFRVDFSEIVFLQSLGNYVRLTLADGQTHLTLATSKEMEAQLPAADFIRIHKTYLINRLFLTKIEGGRAFLGKIELPIGAIFRKDFLKKMAV